MEEKGKCWERGGASCSVAKQAVEFPLKDEWKLNISTNHKKYLKESSRNHKALGMYKGVLGSIILSLGARCGSKA